jgi:hypothetical protein
MFLRAPETLEAADATVEVAEAEADSRFLSAGLLRKNLDRL